MAESVFVHRSGGGRILGVEGSIGSDCYLSRDSVISGKTHVSFMSQVHHGSMLHDTHVSASGISGSVIDGGHISYASVKDSSLENVIVRGTYDPARLENVILSGGVTVEQARLQNFELSGNFLLHCDWDHQPRHFDLKDIGINLGIVECKCRLGMLSAVIGCCCRPIDLWIERKELLRRVFGKRYSWHPNVVDLIHEYFKGWQGSPRMTR